MSTEPRLYLSTNAEFSRLARLLDLAPLGVIVRDFGSDRIVYWSQGAEELYGWSRDEALGQVTHELLFTRFPISRAVVDTELRQNGRWEGELIHRRRDGEERIVVSRQVLERDDRGIPVATLEINVDVTASRREQEAAGSLAESYRLLVDNVRDYAIFLLSPEGRVMSWNVGAERLKGYTRDEIIGEPFTRFYRPGDIAAGLPGAFLDRAATDGRVAYEGWRVRKDGSEFWAYVVLTVLRDAGGELRGFAKITHDLTGRRSAEEARARASREEGMRVAAEVAEAELRTSRDQLSAILAGVAEGITVQDAQGHLIYANAAAARLCGFASVADLLVVPGSEVLERFELFDEGGDSLPPERLPGRLAFAGCEPPEVLVRFRVRSTREERWALVNATPIRDDSGRVVLSVSIFRDITDRRREEQAARFLAAVSAELAGSLDLEVTLQRVASLAVPALADWCVVDLVDKQGELRRVAGAHPEPAMMALADELSARYPDDRHRRADCTR
jgi:PAS domain S-box-containing protein